MTSKIALTLCVLVAVAAAIPAQSGSWGPGAWGAGAWGPGAWGPGAAQPGVAAHPGAAAWGPSTATNPWIPPWIASAPWYPQWTPCTTIGSTCLDCNTKVVCTKVGGLQRACTDPTLPHCNAGECSATPSAECAPATVPAVPA